jgi:hypothetical protein
MRQALHIFKKDVRYLQREVCLLITLAAAFGWAQAPWAEMLLTIAAAYVIARLIHAEAIPGHNQFWITRPYRWKSLLGAKLLFIFLFINLPMLTAQWFMVASAGFPLATTLPGLVWSQVLMIVCVSLPIAALAAVTAGIAPFMFSAFILVAAGFIGSSAMMLPLEMMHPIRGPLTLFVPTTLPGGVEWIRKSLAVAALAFIASPVLYVQYKNRRTPFSRTFGLVGVAVAAVAYIYMPWTAALGIQSRLSMHPFDGSSLQIVLDPSKKGAFPLPGRNKTTQAEVLLPIAISGIPDGIEVQADALAVALQGPDGRTWSSGFTEVNPQLGGAGVTVIYGYQLVDPSFFKDEGGQAVTLRATLYLTNFGNSQSRTIPIQGTPVTVMDGLRCGTGLFNQLYCRSAFRWPRRRVYAKFGEGDIESFNPFISYSPFPASMEFNPFEAHWVSTPSSATQATIVTKEPLSHFRRDFEIRDVHLTDFTRRAASKPPGT